MCPINNQETYPFLILNEFIDFLESIGIFFFILRYKFFWKTWKMNVTLWILDMFLYQNSIPHIGIFGWLDQQLHGYSLNFFQKRYFEKRKKSWKNSYGFWKTN